MTKEEEKQLIIKLLQPLAEWAAIREHLAAHPEVELHLNDCNEFQDSNDCTGWELCSY